jgi:hypothetical protein
MTDTKHVLSDHFKAAIDEALKNDSPSTVVHLCKKRMAFRPAAQEVVKAVEEYLRSKGYDV